VTGGKSSGGLVVREGSKTSSKECSEKLATGAIIQELELQGERLRYKKIRGAGPIEGWVSTMFKGKELLAKHTVRIWTFSCGTRGDVQPYLALNKGLQRMGFEVRIWSNEDYSDFVRSFGVPFSPLFESVEDLIKKMSGGQTSSKPGAPQKSDDKSKDMSTEMMEFSSEMKVDFTRLHMSMLSGGKRVGSLSIKDGVPAEWRSWTEERDEEDPIRDVKARTVFEALGHLWGTANALCHQGALKEKDAKKFMSEIEKMKDISVANEERLKERKEKEEAEQKAKDAASGEDNSDSKAKEGDASDREWSLSKLKSMSTIMDSVMHFGLENGFTCWYYSDPTLLKALCEVLEKEPPDMILFSALAYLVPQSIAAKLGIPKIHAYLQPQGLNLTDPAGPWVTDEIWPTIKSSNPGLWQYDTLADARARYDSFAEAKSPEAQEFQDKFHAKSGILEELVLKPYLGVTAIQDMTRTEFMNVMGGKNAMVGFLSSIGSKRFTKLFGPKTEKEAATHTYTGFWIMDEQDQLASSSAKMFGGEELMKKVEDFIAAGEKPVYMGWGSCVCNRGKEWMAVLAVTSLKIAKMRGIVLGGWAELSYDLLEKTVGADDELGLCQYAKENILFIQKAPQTWLFPKCSVIVIHGGVGTLACAWLSGAPLIVNPVWMDQFQNSFLNVIMQSGYPYMKSVDESDPYSLGMAIKAASSDPATKRGAQAVQLSMSRDKGIQNAAKHIINVLTEEFPSGRWQESFLTD